MVGRLAGWLLACTTSFTLSCLARPRCSCPWSCRQFTSSPDRQYTSTSFLPGCQHAPSQPASRLHACLLARLLACLHACSCLPACLLTACAAAGCCRAAASNCCVPRPLHSTSIPPPPLVTPAEALTAGIDKGDLGGSADEPVVLAREPERLLLLAAMQQRGIALPCYDMIADQSSGSAPVEHFWTQLYDAGGAAEVGLCNWHIG